MTVYTAESAQSAAPLPEEQFPPERLERRLQEVAMCPCCGEAMVLTPRIQCSHCQRSMPIRCQVYRRGADWFAECLTLDLLSKGDTEADAIRRLQIAMFSYVATVAREGESTQGLIPRRAPISSWIRYYSHEFLGRLALLVGKRLPLMIRSVPINEAEGLKIVHC
jgi:hypothetical protein